MATRTVESHADTAASADAIWRTLRDFTAPWHPLVATMRAEHDASGRLIRAFTVDGDDKMYRERLTWFSDSDRTLAYTHVEGIDGADAYDGRLSVAQTSSGGGQITMSATMTAAADRIDAMAEGTQAIFDCGVAAAAALAPTLGSLAARSDFTRGDALRTRRIESHPRLTLSATVDAPGPLCLFLHGIGGARGNWDEQLRALDGHVMAAALDLRGYGDSALGDVPSTIEDYCGDILRVVGEFGGRRLILCGLSYGAWIAASFALRHPDRVAGLILSGGCTGMSEAPPAERAAFRSAREAPLNAGQTPADFAPAVIDVIAGPKATPQTRAALRASMAAIPAATYADALQCFTNPPEKFDFSRMASPVLMMTGAHDVLAPPAEIRSVAQRVLRDAPAPDVRFEVIADAGHVCNLEQPERYNQVMREFIDRISGRG